LLRVLKDSAKKIAGNKRELTLLPKTERDETKDLARTRKI
jgi:hypothetical protein